jgi:hypothetical protein
LKTFFAILAIVSPSISFGQNSSLIRNDKVISVSREGSTPDLDFGHHEVLNRIDSLQSGLTQKIDSLISLPDADDVIGKKVDGLKSQLDSMKNPGVVGDARVEVSKLQEPGQKLEEKVSTLEGKVNEKLGLFSSNGANTPGSIDVSLPSAPGVDEALGDINPELDFPDKNLSLPEAGDLTNIDGASDVKEGISEVTNSQALFEVKDVTNEISAATGQINSYAGEVENLKEGNVDQVVETRAGDLEPVKNLREEIDPATDSTELIKKWNSNPEVAKELALNKAKEQAGNHFLGHENDLKAAMEKLSGMKAKVPDKDQVVDLFAKHPQSLKHQSFRQRLIPGFAFQIQKAQSFWFDLNPQAGYKINGRWLSGFGLNYRWAFDLREIEWENKQRIYGPRMFAQFRVKDNFWLKAEVEYVNSPLRASWPINSEIIGRGWICSFFGGIKKDFQFSKHVKGHVQMLYNMYNPEKKSPYTDRLNVRMGFDFPMSKKEGKKGKEKTGT